MGGSSSKQTVGYRYFANFLLFIGNPIETLVGINFDKRGWHTGERVPMGNNGELIYLEATSLYGENEGGIAGVMRLHNGSDSQQIDPVYKSYMSSIGSHASAYPYQSYISFSGGGLDTHTGGIVDGLMPKGIPGFYLGNSGYMKEMLLWPKRIHVRNDGREQWYDIKSEVGSFIISDTQTRDIQDLLDRPRQYVFPVSQDGSVSIISPGAPNKYGGFNWGGVGVLPGTYVASALLEGNTKYIVTVSGDNTCDFLFSNEGTQSKIISKTSNAAEERIIVEVLTVTGATEMIITVKNHYFPSNPEGRSPCHISFRAEIIETYIVFDKGGGDMNPIHKIREILTDDTAMNKPESDVNNENFIKAADQIWDERLGISWSITEKSCLEAINELCGHIEAGVRINRQTGLYEVVLFRDDWFTDDEIHELAANKIKSLQLEVQNADDSVNQLNVSYYNRALIKDSSFSVAENASIKNLAGHVNAEEIQFPYFMNQRNAAVVAQWKLKQLSSPVWKGTFTTGFYESRKWNRYDLLKLAWPRKWQGTITVRIMKINLGTGTDVSVDFVEVVPYSGNLYSDIVIDEPIDVAPMPPKACQYEPFELPYYLAVMMLGQRKVDEELIYEPNFGLVGVVAEKPQDNSLNAIMMTHSGIAGEEWVRAATIDYDATADLDQIISQTASSFTVKNSGAIANVPAGTLIKCGSDWIGTPGEWMVFQSVDPYTGVVNVKRGALDTLPQPWGIDTKLYFCGNDVAYDQTEYVAGEEVLVSALTTTPSGVLEQGGSIPVEMKARAFCPYPPANVKINGEYWPDEIETDLILTWVDRNRVQQTGGEIIDWFGAGVTIEPGTQTHLILVQLDEDNIELATTNANVTGAVSYTMPISLMQANTRFVTITLKTVRDGFECLSPFLHTAELSQFFSAPYDLTAEFKNDDRLEMRWKLDGFVDEQRYYCSETPIDINNLPAPKAIFPGDLRLYSDVNIELDRTYYIAIESVRNTVRKLSVVTSVKTVIAYRYLRIFITADNGKDNYTEIQEIEVATTVGGVDVTTPSTPAWQSDYYTGGVARTAAKMVDNNFTGIDNTWTSSGSSSFPRWVSFDLGSPLLIAEIRMWSPFSTSFGDFTNRSPKNFVIQVSNDNVLWIDLKTVSNLTGWVRGTPKVILI